MNYETIFPRWARELDRYLPVKSVFFIHRNIYDAYLFPLKTTKMSLPAEYPEQFTAFCEENDDKLSIEENEVTLCGFISSGEYARLNEMAPENGPWLKFVTKLRDNGRDFNSIANLNDLKWLTGRLHTYLYNLLSMHGYDLIVFYDPVDGFTFPYDDGTLKSLFLKISRGKENKVNKGDLSGHQNAAGGPPARAEYNRLPRKPEDALKAIRDALRNTGIPVTVVIRYSSRLLSAPSMLSAEENRLFLQIMKAGEEAALTFSDGQQRRNLLIMLNEKLNDMPPWLYLNNPESKPLQLDLPDRLQREQFFNIMQQHFHEGKQLDENSDHKKKIKKIFCDLTTGMSTLDLDNIRALSVSEEIPATSMKNIIERYKYGIIESDWDKLDREQLENAEQLLRKRVKGQSEAILHLLDVIKRAQTGLTGIQQSAVSNRPRGVLFFAGPTGVGKTELAKSLAELLFGDESRCIRFDMSEFAHEHSDQRLLGAPPGYVGYEEGGQLTNAVKENPFCVLLFDEIEKAHRKIFDKFLQILDDGRMTDGKGETVYFSETIIIFTSNLGTYRRDDQTGSIVNNTDITMNKEEVRKAIINEISNFFTSTLRRPELLNRFGENFIVFDYIRPEIAGEIIDKILDNFTVYLQQEKKLTVVFSDEAVAWINSSIAEKLEFGGRGIGNFIETAVVNPFARWLFDNQPAAGCQIRINSITLASPQNYQLEIEASGF